MSTNELSFWTPIQHYEIYPNANVIANHALGFCLEDCIESYFFCGAEVAIPVSDHEVKLYELPNQHPLTAIFIKVIIGLSYLTIIIPVIIVISKCILRRGVHYTIIQNEHPSIEQEEAQPIQMHNQGLPNETTNRAVEYLEVISPDERLRNIELVNRWIQQGSINLISQELPRISLKRQWDILEYCSTIESSPIISEIVQIALTSLLAPHETITYHHPAPHMDYTFTSPNINFLCQQYPQMYVHPARVNECFNRLRELNLSNSIQESIIQIRSHFPALYPNPEDFPALSNWMTTNQIAFHFKDSGNIFCPWLYSDGLFLPNLFLVDDGKIFYTHFFSEEELFYKSAPRWQEQLKREHSNGKFISADIDDMSLNPTIPENVKIELEEATRHSFLK